MKKTGLLNQPLSNLIAGLGHMDIIVIADAGLPVPAETQRIDLALTQGIPGFIETLSVVLQEMQVEKGIIAEEMISSSPQVYTQLQALLLDAPIETVTHDEFKVLTVKSRAVVRTGEFSPYANVILVSGVIF